MLYNISMCIFHDHSFRSTVILPQRVPLSMVNGARFEPLLPGLRYCLTFLFLDGSSSQRLAVGCAAWLGGDENWHHLRSYKGTLRGIPVHQIEVINGGHAVHYDFRRVIATVLHMINAHHQQYQQHNMTA